jgi:hypothetical protein
MFLHMANQGHSNYRPQTHLRDTIQLQSELIVDLQVPF